MKPQKTEAAMGEWKITLGRRSISKNGTAPVSLEKKGENTATYKDRNSLCKRHDSHRQSQKTREESQTYRQIHTKRNVNWNSVKYHFYLFV